MSILNGVSAPQVPGLAKAEQDTLNELWAQLSARRVRNELRSAYYDGRHAIEQVGTIIPPQYYELGLVLGWSAKAVDMLARRCNVDGIVWPDGDLPSLGLGVLWDDNHLQSTLSQAMASSLLHGVSFLVTTQGGEGEPDALVHVKDALSATGLWSSRTRSLTSALSVNAVDSSSQATDLTLYLSNLTITCHREGARWQVADRSPHSFGVPVEPLVYRPLPGRPYGRSRISDVVMGLQDQAVRTVIRSEAQADVYSFPQMILLGANASIFKNPDGSFKPAWQIALGRVFGVPDDEDATTPRAEVKQFQAPPQTPHMDQLRMQAELFAGETSIPISSLGVTGAQANPTSAESYIASREDLIAEAEGAVDEWSPAIKRTLLHAFQMVNGEREIPAEWSSIGAKFRSPVYVSKAAAADAGMKQITAAPWLAETEVGLELLGLTDQQIARALADRRRASAQAFMNALANRAPAQAEEPAEAPPEVA